jgi:hypothetical protein
VSLSTPGLGGCCSQARRWTTAFALPRLVTVPARPDAPDPPAQPGRRSAGPGRGVPDPPRVGPGPSRTTVSGRRRAGPDAAAGPPCQPERAATCLERCKVGPRAWPNTIHGVPLRMPVHGHGRAPCLEFSPNTPRGTLAVPARTRRPPGRARAPSHMRMMMQPSVTAAGPTTAAAVSPNFC